MEIKKWCDRCMDDVEVMEDIMGYEICAICGTYIKEEKKKC